MNPQQAAGLVPGDVLVDAGDQPMVWLVTRNRVRGGLQIVSQDGHRLGGRDMAAALTRLIFLCRYPGRRQP